MVHSEQLTREAPGFFLQTLYDKEIRCGFTNNISFTVFQLHMTMTGYMAWFWDGLARLKETTFWNGDWKIYFASQTLNSDLETYAYPNPFSPRQEQLKIKYSTGGEKQM